MEEPGSKLAEIDRAEIERACERLVVDYCHLIDHGEAERVAALFTEEAVWRGPGVEMKGREEIRAGFRLRQENAGRMSRHVCNNFRLDVIDPDHAEGVVYLTLYRHDGDADRRVSPLPGPVMVGEYRDRFERTAEGWRIAHRQTIVSFSREGA
jgi:uncharacterized protein (TIGR02246 family)